MGKIRETKLNCGWKSNKQICILSSWIYLLCKIHATDEEVIPDRGACLAQCGVSFAVGETAGLLWVGTRDSYTTQIGNIKHF